MMIFPIFLLSDELNREQELHYLTVVKEGLHQSSQPYKVWPPEKSVENSPLAMINLYDGPLTFLNLP